MPASVKSFRENVPQKDSSLSQQATYTSLGIGPDAGVGTWVTIRIGRPLVPLNFARQRFKADFPFSLLRLRDNAESVALYGGGQVELGVFHKRFSGVFDNFWQIRKRQRRLG